MKFSLALSTWLKKIGVQNFFGVTCGSIVHLDLNIIDFIGKFENFENDVQIIKEKLGLKGKLEHKNKNPIKKDIDWVSEYTKQGIEIVNRIYLCDFKAFDYEMKY